MPRNRNRLIAILMTVFLLGIAAGLGYFDDAANPRTVATEDP